MIIISIKSKFCLDLARKPKEEDFDWNDRLTAVLVEVTMTAWEVVSALFSKSVEPMPEAKWTFIRFVDTQGCKGT